MKRSIFAAILPVTALPLTAATIFSFQQGDLRQDGVLFGSGAGYVGAVDGSITDNNPTGSIGTITANNIGNQFRTTNASAGSNGQQWNALFSYNLSELASFITVNPGFSVSDASFTLIKTGQSGTGGATLNLYQTQPFTIGATWQTSDGSTAWATPNPVNTGGLSGGGTQISQLNSNGVFSTTTSPVTWINSTNSNFIDAVNDALARGDKTLYLAVTTDLGFNGDARITYADLGDATVNNRPELLITLVPEPSAALLGALGALAFLRRRR